ncbi:MAG: hypothetical protein MSL26_11010 [Clostridiales bacterium]|nr:hypothetical protein [Clostridiales bacterium]
MSRGTKRRAKRLIVLLALAALCVLAMLAVRARDTKRLTAALDPIAPDAARDFMRASLVYDAGTRTFRGTQTLRASNRTGEDLEEVVLRAMMNGVSEDSVSITNVTANGEGVQALTDEENPTVVRIPIRWEAGKILELSWTVMIRHAKESAASLITLPQLAVREGGAWRTDEYDALCDAPFAQAFDYALSVNAADGLTLAFGGALTDARWETGVGETLYEVQMQGARDMTFAVGQSQSVLCREAGGVLVSAQATSAGRARSLLDAAQTALDSLEAIGIPYPFPSLTLVEADCGLSDGRVASGLAALAAEGGSEALLRRVTRLVARQTFGVQVGSDPYNAPWLSASLGSAAELLAYAQRKGERALLTRLEEELAMADRVTRPYGVTVGATLAHFGGDAERTQVLRDQGGSMLLGIAQAAGEPAFLEALRLYAQENAGRIAVQADFERALLEATGSAWDGYLADELTF